MNQELHRWEVALNQLVSKLKDSPCAESEIQVIEMLGTAILIKRNAICKDINKILIDEEKKHEQFFKPEKSAVTGRKLTRWYPTESESELNGVSMYSAEVVETARALMEDKEMQDSIKSINDYSWATWRENVDFGYEVQFSRYESSGEDLYGWHVDCGSYDHRTLNWILYLTDDFKGGETEISPDTVLFEEDHETIRKHKACWSLKPEKNTLLIFPSYLVHRVRPSTDGETRKTLNGHIQI